MEGNFVEGGEDGGWDMVGGEAIIRVCGITRLLFSANHSHTRCVLDH